MAEGLTFLENAICRRSSPESIRTLASTAFYAASGNKHSMDVKTFKNLLTSNLPNLVPTTGTEAGFSKVMENMKLRCGEKICFEHFCELIQKLDTNQYHNYSRKKSSCIIL